MYSDLPENYFECSFRLGWWGIAGWCITSFGVLRTVSYYLTQT